MLGRRVGSGGLVFAADRLGNGELRVERHAGGGCGGGGAQGPLRPGAAGRGARRGGARRRWADVADAAQGDGGRGAGLRHEFRLDRLFDEQFQCREPDRAAECRQAHGNPSAGHDGGGRRRPATYGAGAQRGVAVPGHLSGGEGGNPRRRADTARRTDLRRHPAGDAGGVERLQPLGARADHPDQRAAAGADADLAVPPRGCGAAPSSPTTPSSPSAPRRGRSAR